MTTKSNEEATGKKITKKDLMSLFFRSFLLPACYSMDRMQAPGFAYSIIRSMRFRKIPRETTLHRRFRSR